MRRLLLLTIALSFATLPAAAQTVDFQYQIGAAAINTGTWTDVNALDFTSPITGGTAGALNGNLSANRVALSSTITGLALSPGQEIWIRWSDPDHTGNDHGLAIDNFKLIATPVPEPGSVALFACGIALLGALRVYRRTTH